MSLLTQWIAPQYCEKRRIAALRKQFNAAKPFPHLALDGLLRPGKLRQLESAVRRLHFDRKEADLFSFSQSPDLYSERDGTIKEFLALLQSNEFTGLVNAITSTSTKAGKVDASAFIYGDGDHLLCHDDGVSSRRIAYILNLTTLKEVDGGALSLFSASAKNEPLRIVKRIRPKRNTLVIFKVTRRSHHQVEEVLNAKRLTITGWFHA